MGYAELSYDEFRAELHYDDKRCSMNEKCKQVLGSWAFLHGRMGGVGRMIGGLWGYGWGGKRAKSDPGASWGLDSIPGCIEAILGGFQKHNVRIPRLIASHIMSIIQCVSFSDMRALKNTTAASALACMSSYIYR